MEQLLNKIIIKFNRRSNKRRKTEFKKENLANFHRKRVILFGGRRTFKLLKNNYSKNQQNSFIFDTTRSRIKRQKVKTNREKFYRPPV